jgi:hypothetical protein
VWYGGCSHRQGAAQRVLHPPRRLGGASTPDRLRAEHSQHIQLAVWLSFASHATGGLRERIDGWASFNSQRANSHDSHTTAGRQIVMRVHWLSRVAYSGHSTTLGLARARGSDHAFAYDLLGTAKCTNNVMTK